jgi:hypothetical protein
MILARSTARTEADSPVFILASGVRCGSTLLQRFLCSHPDVMIWGDPGGLPDNLRHALDAFTNRRGEEELGRFLDRGADSWIAYMRPDASTVVAAARSFLLELFETPAMALGRPTWGFKDVASDVDAALFLQSIFPGARFIHLTRSLRACVASQLSWVEAGVWSREQLLASIQTWMHVNQGFLSTRALGLSSLARLRYEDLVQDPGVVTHELCDFLDLDRARCDLGVFDHYVRGPDDARYPAPRELSPADEALLQLEEIDDLHARLGYELALA